MSLVRSGFLKTGDDLSMWTPRAIPAIIKPFNGMSYVYVLERNANRSKTNMYSLHVGCPSWTPRSLTARLFPCIYRSVTWMPFSPLYSIKYSLYSPKTRPVHSHVAGAFSVVRKCNSNRSCERLEPYLLSLKHRGAPMMSLFPKALHHD